MTFRETAKVAGLVGLTWVFLNCRRASVFPLWSQISLEESQARREKNADESKKIKSVGGIKEENPLTVEKIS